MSTTTPRTIARRAALVAGIAASVAAVAPGAASAAGFRTSCVGATIEATADYQKVYGTACADTIYVRGYKHVQVFAGGGNDKVYAGYGPGGPFVDLGSGNDHLRNDHDRQVNVQGGAGDDLLEGHTFMDVLDGGPGIDTAEVNSGDHYYNLEHYLPE